nr:MAG TPA: hypothetical protein [Bacteriophage sp.]
MRKADRVIFEVSLGQLSFVSPRLWGVDCGFGGFCKGSWEKKFPPFEFHDVDLQN